MGLSCSINIIKVGIMYVFILTMTHHYWDVKACPCSDESAEDYDSALLFLSTL